MKPWINKVRAGDFAAIPANMDFDEASELALVIDGFGLTGGVPQLMKLSNRVAFEISVSGWTTASALDRWLALFGQQRAYHHFGYGPEGQALHEFNLLAKALRSALLQLTPSQRAGIMSVLRFAKTEKQKDLFDE